MQNKTAFVILAVALLVSSYDVLQETTVFLEGKKGFIELPLPYLIFALVVFLVTKMNEGAKNEK